LIREPFTAVREIGLFVFALRRDLDQFFICFSPRFRRIEIGLIPSFLLTGAAT
jgi:hypothetical protein